MMIDYIQPLNLGSDELVSMNEMAKMVMNIANRSYLEIVHIPGHEGVRGRNTNNERVNAILSWNYTISLQEGLKNYIRGSNHN